MQDYDTDVLIVSVMKYGKEKVGTRLELLLIDPTLCGNNDKYVGSTLVTQWYSGTNVFDQIVSNNLILKACSGHFVTKKDFKDPTKLSSKLESLKYKDNVVTLLQSDAR